MSLRLEKITSDNLEAVCAIAIRPDQEHLVEPVAMSLAEAYVHGDIAWPRAIVEGNNVVGFVMAFLDVQFSFDPPGQLRDGLWRLNIDAGRQDRGYGTFAVQAVCEEIRQRGRMTASVTFVPGDDGPEGFYRGLGFELTEHKSGDQTVAVLNLD